MIHGTIVNYNSNAKFGFVRGEDGTDYFLHIGNFRLIEAGEKTPVFTRETMEEQNGAMRALLEPRVGLRVVFEARPGQGKNNKASPWGYEDNFEAMLAEIVARPPQQVTRPVTYPPRRAPAPRRVEPKYQVLAWMKNAENSSWGKPKVEFTGTAEEIGRKYRGGKDLLPYSHDNIFDTKYTFRRLEGNEWVDCENPLY
jgi:hypothetical protein